MLRNAVQKTLKLIILNKLPRVSINKSCHIFHSSDQSQQKKGWFKKKPRSQFVDADSSELTTTTKARDLIQKEFSDYYSDGKFINRISYVDYIDQALEKLVDLGLEKDLNAYKELLKVFPPGKYHPRSSWDIGMFSAPQQICAMRLLFQMEQNMVRPDKEVEELVIRAFSKHSTVWLKCARMNYWSMKSRNIDLYPLPEVIPEKTHEIAKVALERMLDDPKSIISVNNTSSLPDVVDKTWIIHSQSPIQRSIIERLSKKTILYLEEAGSTYVQDKFLSYFVLKCYEDEETLKKKNQPVEIDYNYNTLKMKFYGKPIVEKITELDDMHRVDDGYILGIAITGTSSHDSVLSWLKLMQKRNPNLANLNVVFRLQRPVTEVMKAEEN